MALTVEELKNKANEKFKQAEYLQDKAETEYDRNKCHGLVNAWVRIAATLTHPGVLVAPVPIFLAEGYDNYRRAQGAFDADDARIGEPCGEAEAYKEALELLDEAGLIEKVENGTFDVNDYLMESQGRS